MEENTIFNDEGITQPTPEKTTKKGAKQAAEACSLNDGLDRLTEAGFAVVGVSKDSQESHRKFADKFALKFPLIADTELTLNEAFGVWQKKKMAGREYMGTVRTTFIIDENGIIADIITKVQTKDSANQILDLKG